MVTVASVSSPGDIDVVKLISGGDSRSVTEVELDTLILLMLGLEGVGAEVTFLRSITVSSAWSIFDPALLPLLVSMSGVRRSTEILRRDVESSDDNVLEETAWEW